MIYLELVWSFFQIGLFSFGGGYAALPLIREQVVELHGWLTLAEFTDLITISQMTPGPIAINSASFVGYRIAGVGGAVLATLGNVLPSIIIVLILARLYKKYKELPMIQDLLSGLRPAIVALIAGAALDMMNTAFWGDAGVAAVGLGGISWIAVGIFLGALLLIRRTKLDPIVIMLGSGILGGAVYYLVG